MPADNPTPATAGPDVPHSQRIQERAIVNTLYRSGGEIVGRFASLLLFAVAGHILGQSGLGAFVFAVAFLGLVSVLVDLGLDRYMLRAIALERRAVDRLFFNVFALKLALAIPLFGIALIGLAFIGHSDQVLLTTVALAPGVICDSLARTQLAAFIGHERSGPPALADTIQRVCSAVLGIAALEAGYGVVSVAVTYSAGSALGVLIGFVQLPRTIGMPGLVVRGRSWRELASSSIPFATQDIFSSVLARADVLILALIASQAAVGVYGAAYRLFESTVFVTYALAGAYAAMFTYLRPDSDPPVRLAFQRSIKLAMVLLTPIAVAFMVLAGPICRLIYGASFSASATPLELLGPAVVLLGIVTLSTSLMVSRENPRRMIPVIAAVAGLNFVINLVLIPAYGPSGAAAAMLATEIIFALWILRIAARAVGALQWTATGAGTLAAGATMALLALALHSSLAVALVAGSIGYVIVLLSVERILNPEEVAQAARMVRRRRSLRAIE